MKTLLWFFYIKEQQKSEKGKIPCNYNKGKRSGDWKLWETAIQTEMDKLEEMKAWELIDVPPRKRSIANK